MTARKCTACFMLRNEMDKHALNSISLPRVGFLHGINWGQKIPYTILPLARTPGFNLIELVDPKSSDPKAFVYKQESRT